MSIDPKAEAELSEKLRALAYDALAELRDTLSPTYNARSLGYESVEHARLTIIKMADKHINKLSAKHLRKHGS